MSLKVGKLTLIFHPEILKSAKIAEIMANCQLLDSSTKVVIILFC